MGKHRKSCFYTITIVGIIIGLLTITATRVYAGMTTDHKVAVIEHELMHALGPGHVPFCPSLMGPSCGSITYPTTYDKYRFYNWQRLGERPPGGVYWAKGTTCVENHANTSWPVYTATTRMDALPWMKLVYTRSSCVNLGYKQIIRVYSGDYYASEGKTWYASTLVWHQTYDEDGDGVNAGDIEKAELKLNNHHL